MVNEALLPNPRLYRRRLFVYFCSMKKCQIPQDSFGKMAWQGTFGPLLDLLPGVAISLRLEDAITPAGR
jgi:hypothetical protein